jgi:sorting nexin-29
MVLGDMNAKVGREEIYRPAIGKWSLHEVTNENGLRLIDFATEKGMVIKSTFFRHKRIHQATWESPDGVTRNQIDHCLIDGRHFSDVINVKLSRGANVDSDHFLVVVDVRAHLCVARSTNSQATRRFAISKLKDPSISKAFSRQVNTRVPQLRQQDPATDLTSYWNNISQVLIEEATNIIGFETPSDGKGWWDDDCKEVTDRKNEARAKKLERPTRSAKENYEKLRREEKKLHKKKKKEFQNRTLEELESLRDTNDYRKFYKILNAQRRGFNPRNDMCRALDGTLLTNKTDVLARWVEHFDALLNEDAETTDSLDPGFLGDDGDPSNVHPPTRQDVVDALKWLKNNKAPGPEGITAEVLKSCCDELISNLHELITTIWSTESLPSGLMEGSLCPFHKKGDKLLCKNYREICLLSAAYKIFAIILYNRLLPHAETILGDYQCGFRRDRSTTDQIFNVRLILQKGREFNVDTYHLFIDFKAAYDKIKRKELLVVMKELDFEPKLIRLVAASLNGSKCRVKLGNDLSDPFEVREGLKQGDALSTLLFNVALEGAMRRAGIQSSRTLATNMVQILAFADDVDIVGRRHTDVVEAYTSLKREAAKIGLLVNEEKTKYMKTSDATVPQQVGNSVTIDGQNFEVVKEFIYLGVLIRADNDISQEIKRRIMAANRCFFGLQKHLRSDVLIKTKLIIVAYGKYVAG